MAEVFAFHTGKAVVEHTTIKYDGLVKSRQSCHPGESRGPDTVPAEAGNQTIESGFRLSPSGV